MFTVSGVETDPSTVYFEYEAPDGIITQYTDADPEIVKEGIGIYHIDLTLSERGSYDYRWYGVMVLWSRRRQAQCM